MTRAPAKFGAALAGLVCGLVASWIPGFVSVYNPYQAELDPRYYAPEPIITQPALVNTLLASVIATVVMWYFARKWSGNTIAVLFVLGIVLTIASVVFLMVAASQPVGQSGVILFLRAWTGTIAMPCVSVLSVIMPRKGTKGPTGDA